MTVDTVLVTGCSTSGCIRATCESAMDYGFRAIVPAEAVGEAAEEQRAEANREVNVLVAVHVPQARAAAALDDERVDKLLP